jgi:hypothetical protein
MNIDYRHDASFCDHIRSRITRADISPIIEAKTGITLGMFYSSGYSGTNFHYQSARPGSRARKLNPMAGYALNNHYLGEKHNLYAILNELFLVAKIPLNFLGFPPQNPYPKATNWPGWPFGFTEN